MPRARETPKLPTFRELVDREYTSRGVSKYEVLYLLKVHTSLSVQAVCAAYEGRLVRARTAAELNAWATKTFRTELDMLAMLTAPPRQRKAPRESVGA